MTVEEAFLGITRNAGLALGRPELGWLGEGSVGDVAVFAPPPGEPPTVASLVQNMGGRETMAVVCSGRIAYADSRAGVMQMELGQ